MIHSDKKVTEAIKVNIIWHA